MADAPFLIRPPTAHPHSLTKSSARDGNVTARRQGRESGRGLSLGTVHGDHNIEGTLYWNQDVVSSGLVCGTSSKQVLRTVMQMVRLHLNEGRDSSALIFHASTCDHLLASSRVNTVQLAKRLSSPSVFLSPRARPAVKARYLQTPLPEHDVLPLRIAEKDITLAHVLSLCTPPSDYPSRERILTSVQYIVSRMAEPFSIQEFNQLVDNEQWDEHGSSFMAIRQTLLTTFIIPSPFTSDGLKPQSIDLGESDDIVTRIMKGGPIIVDLSDPILRSTGLDSTLFDMILCLYCVVNPDSRKLLVLDAHEYLANPAGSISGSNLSNTLTTLLSLHGDSPIKTLLSCSTDMAHIPQQLLSHLDYLICHEFRSPAWVEYIQKYFFASPSLSPNSINGNSSFSTGEGRRNSSSLYTLEDRHAIIISPRSLLSEAQAHSLSPIVEEDTTPPNSGIGSRHGTKWGMRSFRVEIGWEWPLTVEQQKIEQLQALVAQLSQISQNRDHHRESVPPSVNTDAFKTTGTSDGTLAVANANADGNVASSVVASTHNRRSRKESSTYMETTMTALKSALGYLAARRAVDLSSPPSSPKEGGTGLLPLVLPSSRTPPPPIETQADKLGNQSGDVTDPSSDGAEWLRKRGLDAKFTMPSRVRSLQDLGPFPAQVSEALEVDRDKLAEALLEAIIRAGGERGMPISSQKVAEQYRRLTSDASTELNRGSIVGSGLSMWNGVPALTGFTTWVETINYAQKAGILQLVSNGKEDWVVMPKDSVQSRPMSVVQSPDGWYEVRKDVEQQPPTPPAPETSVSQRDNAKQPINLAIFDPLVQSITTLRQLQATSSAILLHSVSYELKRRFPTALKDADYKTILEYLHGAQEHGLLEVTDDDSGSIYVQLTTPAVLEKRKSLMVPSKPPISIVSVSTDKSQPESSAMPSSAAHIPYPRDRFEPIIAVLRSLKKHNLYKVTLVPLSLAIQKMFPDALARFGFINIEAYVTQAHNAGLIISGVDSNGRTWVSLAETVDTPGSITPTQEQLNAMRISEESSVVSASDFPLPPAGRVSDFSRLLRSVRALASSGHERVLCSRVGMMLNKEDYKAMNVETFSQCLVAAAKANLVVHGGVGGTAWVALKAPEVAGISRTKMEEPRSRLVKTAPPEYATNPVAPSGSAYKLPLSEQDVEPFKPLLAILRTFIHGKHIAEPFRTVVEKNLIKAKPDVLSAARCHTMDDYILRAQSYGLIAQVGNGKAARLRLLENSGLLST